MMESLFKNVRGVERLQDLRVEAHFNFKAPDKKTYSMCIRPGCEGFMEIMLSGELDLLKIHVFDVGYNSRTHMPRILWAADHPPLHLAAAADVLVAMFFEVAKKNGFDLGALFAPKRGKRVKRVKKGVRRRPAKTKKARS